jgi:hypothetical protein
MSSQGESGSRQSKLSTQQLLHQGRVRSENNQVVEKPLIMQAKAPRSTVMSCKQLKEAAATATKTAEQ